MNLIKGLSIIAALGIAMLACTFTFNSDVQGMSVGDTQTKEIDVSAENTDENVKVRLEFGAGELKINPGSGEALVSGTATYNVEEFEPQVTETQSMVKISQQVENVNLIPAFGNEVENRWDLELGSKPMDLDISAGGYQGDYELGGIPLHELRVAEGAAKTDLSFSKPNPVEMDILRYDTGASQATLSGLANANFREMDFRSGAGEYRLDFSGQLQQDADVRIKSGLSSIVIIVPEGTAATVQFEGGLANVDRSGDWRLSGDVYSLAGDGPELRITVELGAGNLELRVR
ncbi:MAG: toast rack family protein [Anaerolineales bacterium]